MLDAELNNIENTVNAIADVNVTGELILYTRLMQVGDRTIA